MSFLPCFLRQPCFDPCEQTVRKEATDLTLATSKILGKFDSFFVEFSFKLYPGQTRLQVGWMDGWMMEKGTKNGWNIEHLFFAYKHSLLLLPSRNHFHNYGLHFMLMSSFRVVEFPILPGAGEIGVKKYLKKLKYFWEESSRLSGREEGKLRMGHKTKTSLTLKADNGMRDGREGRESFCCLVHPFNTFTLSQMIIISTPTQPDSHQFVDFTKSYFLFSPLFPTGESRASSEILGESSKVPTGSM